MLNSVLISLAWPVHMHMVLREDRKVTSFPFIKVYFPSELVPGK